MRIKSTHSLAIVFSLLFSAFILLIPFSRALAETITLSYATNTAPLNLRGEAEKMFLEEIQKHTGGAVKINPYWGQSLLKGKEILKGINDGVVDMGHVNINYYPKRLLLNSAIVLTQEGPTKYENIMWVYEKMYNEVPILNKELKKFNQKIIYIYSVLPVAICFTKPVTKLDDFKGKRIRAASRWPLAILKGAGAIPVSVPWGDCYMALQTNAIEGVYTSLDSLHRVKLDEVAPYIWVAKELWIPTPYLITINLDKWNKLPKDIRTKIGAAAKSSQERFSLSYAKWFDKIINEQRSARYTVTFASKSDINKWKNLPEVQEIQKQWITEATAAGANDAKSVLFKVKQIVQEGIDRDSM